MSKIPSQTQRYDATISALRGHMTDLYQLAIDDAIGEITRLRKEVLELRSRLDEVEKANAEASGRMKALMLIAPPLSTRWQQIINACINILELKNPPESGSEVRG